MSDKKIMQEWQLDIVDVKTGIIENRTTQLNVITDEGLNVLLSRYIGDNGGKYATHCGIGTGTTQGTSADPTLVNEIASARTVIADASAYRGSVRMVARFVHDGTDRDIFEAGVFDAATNGNMLARVVSPTAKLLRANKALTATITMSISSVN